jgi:hypothetical protein
MKKLGLLVSGLFLASTVAHALPKGVVYSRSGTEGEYPAAFRVTAKTMIRVARVPGPLEKLHPSCRLAKGTELIFARMNVRTQTYQVQRERAKVDTQFDSWEGEGSISVKVPAGAVVETLSYYAEGACLKSFQGKQYDAGCYGEDEDFEVLQELKQESWVRVSCANGVVGWTSQALLESNPKLEGFLYNPYTP